MPEAAPREASVALPDVVGTAAEETAWPDRVKNRLTALHRLEATAGAQRDYEALENRLGKIARSVDGRRRVAVHVRDLDSGQVVFDRAGARMLNPASNQKLLTASAAVELLGPDYVFETKLLRKDDSLYLVGSGDPGFMVTHLYDMAQGAPLEGIERIVVDESAFSPEHFGPGYDPHGPGVAYMAPSSALSMSFNTVVIEVSPGDYQTPVEVSLHPLSTKLVVENEAYTGGGTDLTIDTEARGDLTVVKVSGAMAAGHGAIRTRRRIYDPAAFTGGALAEILAGRDESLPLDIEHGTAPADAEVVAVHRSLPLARGLDSALKYSNNFSTEQVLRTLAWRGTGEPGSWQNGTDLVARYWDAVGNDDALEFVNGSGLSREGRATPRALVDLLARTRQYGSAPSALLPTLAGAGGEGTLRLRVPKAEGRVRAKTGTLNGVCALSGVVASQDGKRMLGFSILVNGGRAVQNRALQDRMLLAMLAEIDRA